MSMHRLYDAGIIMLFVVLFFNPFYGRKGTKMFFVLRSLFYVIHTAQGHHTKQSLELKTLETLSILPLLNS